MPFRIGMGFDAHRLVSGRALILGGVEIPHDRGLEGHSDGDALLHALTDAILGAVGGPDIGSLFPSGDARWKQASSKIFVEKALEVVQEKGYRVTQVDTVLIAEEPRLAGHFDSMRDRVAEVLGLAVEQVGIKATTTDGMGFTGRGEGIAAQAVALVAKISD
jgi:2-C-methyl-D-erythritol 2,4-cyclodiphosphate synthase